MENIELFIAENKIFSVDVKLEKISNRKHLDWFELKEVPKDAPVLSITGESRLISKKSCEFCGQISEEMRFYVKNFDIKILKDDMSIRDLLTFLEIWDKFHLNDMKAGTFIQESFLYLYRDSEKWDFYTYDCELLEKYGLLVDRGYKYGNSWLYCPIPEYAIDFLKEKRFI